VVQNPKRQEKWGLAMFRGGESHLTKRRGGVHTQEAGSDYRMGRRDRGGVKGGGERGGQKIRSGDQKTPTLFESGVFAGRGVGEITLLRRGRNGATIPRGGGVKKRKAVHTEGSPHSKCMSPGGRDGWRCVGCGKSWRNTKGNSLNRYS